MIYYFLPGSGIYGGIKVGYQFVQALRHLGYPAAVASSDGKAAKWFSSDVPVLSAADALERKAQGDICIFSLPHDYSWLRPISEKLVFHCQGTDSLIDSILEDKDVTVLTCWAQAEEYVKKRGARPIDVGISISNVFWYAGQEKPPSSVAAMPRRGANFIEQFREEAGVETITLIDQASEWETAELLAGSRYFLASSEGEWFGLPALEAMAAGCVVLSAWSVGGTEYLKPGQNCWVGSPEQLARAYQECELDPRLADQIALSGMHIARDYSEARWLQKVARAIKSLDWGEPELSG